MALQPRQCSTLGAHPAVASACDSVRGVLQLNFHLKIVNPIFEAVVEALPSFQVGMAQALQNTENWRRMAEGKEPVMMSGLPAAALATDSNSTGGGAAAARADAADPA